MPINVGDVMVVHSGGAANNLPAGDLGGAISTHASKRVKSQLGTRTVTNISGVTILDAYGNPEGIGSLFYDYSETSLGWRPAGLPSYYGVSVATNGQYVIGSSSGYLLVQKNTISPTNDLYDNVTIANNQQNLFPAVSASDSLLGKIEYRCVFVLNSHATDSAVGVKLWMISNTPAGDTIDIGLDPAGKNAVAAIIPNGTTAPAGVTFSAPSTQGAGLVIGTLAPGDYYAFWQRRTVPLETRGTVISNGAAIGISIDI